MPRGFAILQDPTLNKGTAFNERERDALGLRGLLPPHVLSQDEQARRALEHIRRQPTDLEKFIELSALHDRNETLFFRIVCDAVAARDAARSRVTAPSADKATNTAVISFMQGRGSRPPASFGAGAVLARSTCSGVDVVCSVHPATLRAGAWSARSAMG